MIQGSRKVTIKDYDVELPLMIIREEDDSQILFNKKGSELLENTVFLDYESDDEHIDKLIIINSKHTQDIYYNIDNTTYVLPVSRKNSVRRTNIGASVRNKSIRSYMNPGIYSLDVTTLGIDVLDKYNVYEATFVCSTLHELNEIMNDMMNDNVNTDEITVSDNHTNESINTPRQASNVESN